MRIPYSGGFGSSGLRFTNLEMGAATPRFSNLNALYGFRAENCVRSSDLALSYRSKKAVVIGCRSSNSEAEPHCEC